MRLRVLSMAVCSFWLAHGSARAATCDVSDPNWIACEDFEAGGLGWAGWFAQSPFTECNGCSGAVNDPARIRLTNSASNVRDGQWALEMPAEASAGYTGASLTFRSCADNKQAGCALTGYDELFFRTWVKLAPDHQYVHHFLALAGTRPDAYWESDGNAGCRPNGYRAAGTTLDFNGNHELFFYTYYPNMGCDSGGYCSGAYVQQICDGCATKDMPCSNGPECCWGNLFSANPRPVLPRDQWVCLEISQRLNTPGQADGEMSFWVNDTLGHRQTGMQWRDVSELQLNKAWLQHYIATGDATQSNRVWFDDMVVSTQRIGCAMGAPGNDAGPNDPDASSSAVDGGSGNNTATGGCGCCVGSRSGTGSSSQPGGWPVIALLLVGLCHTGARRPKR